MLLNVIYINKERCLVLLVSHHSVCLVLHWWQPLHLIYPSDLRILQLPIFPLPSQPFFLPFPPPPPKFFFLLITQCEKCLVLMLELIAWRCAFTSHGDKTLSRDRLTDCAIKWKPLELLNYNETTNSTKTEALNKLSWHHSSIPLFCSLPNFLEELLRERSSKPLNLTY